MVQSVVQSVIGIAKQGVEKGNEGAPMFVSAVDYEQHSCRGICDAKLIPQLLVTLQYAVRQ